MPGTTLHPAPAEIAKAALRRLALSKLEPTPENYAAAWAQETGRPVAVSGNNGSAKGRPIFEKLVARLFDDAGPREDLLEALMRSEWETARRLVERAADHQVGQSQAWAQTLEKLARGLERGGRQWTSARKKDSLQRVLDGNRSDSVRLQQRLKQLVVSWENDVPDEAPAPEAAAPASPLAAAAAPAAPAAAALPAALPVLATAPTPSAPPVVAATTPIDPAAQTPPTTPLVAEWTKVLGHYDAALRSALPIEDERAKGLESELRDLLSSLERDGVTEALRGQSAEVCDRARRMLSHRHHLVGELHKLTREMSAGLTELAEDDSWVKGQGAHLQASLGDVPSVRSVRAASEMLAHTRARQQELRHERDEARHALKDAITQMLAELDDLGDHTGRFTESVSSYVETVSTADSLESLAGVMSRMVAESRAVHGLVSHTQDRLRDSREKATGLEERVRSLEDELRRLSDEVSTDVLTEVANRRGLMRAFDAEMARFAREGGELAVGLLDIDNFKKLNDSLGHAAGDVALKTLASHVQKQLRPVDLVARFGGEEFVVLLPGAPVAEAQATLTRLQRTLTASLFMHDGREVFVTFSAGVTRCRVGEAMETALERADEALYEAKRSGKNRTCIG